ncbi:MAG TPA: hypothetical protein VM536_17610 [Chloroflexia bacterium]|nr:hypothetical protein [Chloroflexia bacterium]
MDTLAAIPQVACVRCGTVPTTRQKFCGECGWPLEEGVTRQLPAYELPEQRGRLAGGSVAPLTHWTLPAAEPRSRRSGRFLALFGVGLAVAGLLLAGALTQSRPAPAPMTVPAPILVPPAAPPVTAPGGPAATFVQVSRGEPAELRPGVRVTLDEVTIRPLHKDDACGAAEGVGVYWAFTIVNASSEPSTLVADRSMMSMADGVGGTFPAVEECDGLGGALQGPYTVAANSTGTGLAAMHMPALSAAANRLELHLMISGTQFTFLNPLP